MSLQDPITTDEASSSKPQQVVGAAVDQAKDLSESASAAARDVAATTKDQAAQVAHEASRQLEMLMGEARETLRSRVDEQTDQLHQTLESWAGQARALSEGRIEEAGGAARYAGQMADRLEHVAHRIETRGFDGMVVDVERFARRRPGIFLLGAAAIGFGVGRLVRGAKGGEPDSQGPGAVGTLTPGIGPPSSAGVERSFMTGEIPSTSSWSSPSPAEASAPASRPRQPGGDYTVRESDLTTSRPVPPVGPGGASGGRR